MDRVRQAGNLAIIWAAFSAYPHGAPVVNRGLQAGLGNETEWQIPETVDEAVVHTALEVGKNVAQSSWTFQLLTILMTCGNLIGLLRLVVDVRGKVEGGIVCDVADAGKVGFVKVRLEGWGLLQLTVGLP